MIRTVILGCENSHAHTFLKILAEHPEYADIKVVGVYSDEPQPAQALHETFGVPVMSAFDEAAGCEDRTGFADAVIVTARNGDNHYKYAAPYLASGVPMFIDKPVTTTEEDAVRLVTDAARYGVRLTGGSCCRFADGVQRLKAEHRAGKDGSTLGGSVRAPISLVNGYGNFYFYAQHLVEMVMEIYGRFPRAVRAARNGQTISVLFRYDGFDVTGLYVDGNYRYTAGRYAEGGDTLCLCDIGQSCFDREFDEFVRLARGGDMECTYADFIAPVFVLNAIDRAIESGREQPVAYRG